MDQSQKTQSDKFLVNLSIIFELMHDRGYQIPLAPHLLVRPVNYHLEKWSQ